MSFIPDDMDEWGTGETVFFGGRRVVTLRRGPVTFIVTKDQDAETWGVTKMMGGRELAYKRLRNIPPALRSAIEHAKPTRLKGAA